MWNVHWRQDLWKERMSHLGRKAVTKAMGTEKIEERELRRRQ